MTAFILHVDYLATTEAAATKVFAALHIYAEHQIVTPFPGVVCYNFSRDVENPLLFHFVEIYEDAAVFWAHAMDQKIQKAFQDGFDLSHRKWMQIHVAHAGDKLDDTVTMCINTMFPNCSISKASIGSVLQRASSIASSSPSPPNPILFTWRFDGANGEILSSLAKLAEHGKSLPPADLICFEASQREYRAIESSSPTPNHCTELIALYRTPAALIAHLGSSNGPSAITTDLGQRVASSTTVVNLMMAYGATSGAEVFAILSALSKNVRRLPTTEGYLLHPQVNEVLARVK